MTADEDAAVNAALSRIPTISVDVTASMSVKARRFAICDLRFAIEKPDRRVGRFSDQSVFNRKSQIANRKSITAP